jgi:hypothetical protein
MTISPPPRRAIYTIWRRHDAGGAAVPFAAAGVPIWPGFCPLSLSFSYLSHAKHALLRRNIISFQAVADDYFAYKRLNRHCAGPY